MRQPETLNIEHPDINQMRDDQLSNEAMYLYNYAIEICLAIQQGFANTGNGAANKPPVWKTIEDLNLASFRYEAVCEEIQYRATQMR